VSGEPTAVHYYPNATVHMVVGTGGASFTNNSRTPSPSWSERVFYRYGYSRLIVYNAS
jgi:hypothetical protein